MGLLKSIKSVFTPAPRVSAADAGQRVRSGAALLVDVREPDEWSYGVAKDAALLPLSDLTGSRTRWKEFLSHSGDREVLLYCASGMRSGTAARILASEGFKASNTGGLTDWVSSGWPLVRPARRGK